MWACPSGCTRAAGPAAHPTRQPVSAKSLPPEPTVMVRSRIPGRSASRRCVPGGKTQCSYTSSETATRSCSVQTAATASSSSTEATCLVGLCGELTTTILTLGPAAASFSASISTANSGGRIVTTLGTAPHEVVNSTCRHRGFCKTIFFP